MTQKRNFFF